MRTLLRSGPFAALVTGQAVSAFGDWMVTVALMALVLDLSGSSAAVGAILVLRLLPAAVAGPVVSRVVVRRDRRQTMLAMDGLRAAIVALVPLVRALWWVYTLAFMLEVASLVFLPARDASIPDLVGEDDLPLANGLVLASSYATIPLGAGAFAAVSALAPHHHGFLPHHPFAVVFWVDALTFLVSFAFVRRLPPLTGPPASASEPVTGFRQALRLPFVRAVAGATLTVALGLGTLFSLGIVYVRHVLHATDTQFGVLIALFGVGAAAGLGLLRAYGSADLAAVRAGAVAQGMTIAVMSLAPGVGLAFVGACLFGAATAWTLAAGMSALQERLEGDERVLAFAAFHVLIRVGLAGAAIGSGVAADLVGSVRWPLVGRLQAARLVLACAGVVVASGAMRIQTPQPRETKPA